ncbi:MAG: permease, partial [Myxococcales bacterium]|nr:permease [Myxococcales bacterium]
MLDPHPDLGPAQASTHGYEILALSTAIFVLGPLLHRVARRERVTMAALDSFVIVAVIGLVLLEILPAAIDMSGWTALLAAAVGLAGPLVAEGPLRLAARKTHKTLLFIAVIGMGLHAFTDGVALAGAHLGQQGHGIEIAIIAHQLPVAMAVWWLLSPISAVRASVSMVLIAAASVAGFFVAAPSLALLDGDVRGLFTALVGGLLLHVITHRPQPGPAQAPARRERLAVGVGSLAALGLLSTLFSDAAAHTHHGPGASPSARVLESLVALTRESAPALLLGFGVAGLVGAYLPGASVRWLRRGRGGARAIRGVLFGLPLPLCSCGVVPVYRSLALRGVPAASGLAFLVATPELGIDAVLLSIPLLGPHMTVARVVGAALVALLVGWLVGGRADRQAARAPADDEDDAPRPGPRGRSRLVRAVQLGLVDLVDSIGPWIVVGLLLAALLAPWLDAGSLAAIPRALAVPLFAIVGIPIYVCASGATPLVAVLLAKGLTPGAALAFLLTGPATNATTFGVLTRLHGRRLSLVFALVMVALSVLLGWGLDLVAARVPELSQVPDITAAHAHADGGLLGELALLGVVALFTVSFLRQGPRGFLAQLSHGFGHVHDHDHGGCCEHEHAGSAEHGHDHGGDGEGPGCGHGHDHG